MGLLGGSALDSFGNDRGVVLAFNEEALEAKQANVTMKLSLQCLEAIGVNRLNLEVVWLCSRLTLRWLSLRTVDRLTSSGNDFANFDLIEGPQASILFSHIKMFNLYNPRAMSS